MPAYIISYDLNKEREGYSAANKALNDAIRNLSGTRCKPLESFWVIVTDISASAIRDALLPYLDDNDELLVIRSGIESAWTRSFSPEVSAWLKKHL